MANRAAPATHQAGLAPAWQLATFDSNWDSPITAHNDSSLGQVNGVPTDTGSANNYIVACPFGSPTSYQQGMTVTFKAVNANTSSSTLTVSPLTAVQLVNIFGNPLVQGDILANTVISCTYNGTAFVVMSPIMSNIMGSGVGNFANARVIADDFFGPNAAGLSPSGSLFGALPWQVLFGTTGHSNYTNAGASSSSKAFGELGGSTGTSSGGGSTFVAGSFWSALGAMELDFRLLLSNLPNATDNFVWAFGVVDNILNLNSNGVYFEGTFSSTPILEGRCFSGGVSTTTSTIALTSSVYHRYRVLLNAGWTTAQFFVDGAQLGSNVTTNIPTNSILQPTMQIIKSAGTADVSFSVDQFYMSYLYNS